MEKQVKRNFGTMLHRIRPCVQCDNLGDNISENLIKLKRGNIWN